MDWKEYVGELFKGPDNVLYEAEAYDPRYGFRLSERGNSHHRIKVSIDELCEKYQYIFNTQAEPIIKSIKNTEDAYNLLDRAIFNIRLNVPINEIIALFKEDGYSDYDIFLTIRGAVLLVRL